MSFFRSSTAKTHSSASGSGNHLAAGDLARDTGAWQQAVDHYEAHLAQNADDAAIWVQLGNCAKEAGNLELSLKAYTRAIEIAPEVADSHLQLGHLVKIMGRLRQAIDCYRRALELDPALADARHEITRLSHSIANAPFLLPPTYLDYIVAETPAALIDRSTAADRKADPFQIYASMMA